MCLILHSACSSLLVWKHYALITSLPLCFCIFARSHRPLQFPYSYKPFKNSREKLVKCSTKLLAFICFLNKVVNKLSVSMKFNCQDRSFRVQDVSIKKKSILIILALNVTPKKNSFFIHVQCFFSSQHQPASP